MLSNAISLSAFLTEFPPFLLGAIPTFSSKKKAIGKIAYLYIRHFKATLTALLDSPSSAFYILILLEFPVNRGR